MLNSKRVYEKNALVLFDQHCWWLFSVNGGAGFFCGCFCFGFFFVFGGLVGWLVGTDHTTSFISKLQPTDKRNDPLSL